MTVCQVCGNEIERGRPACRFCGSRQEGESQPGRAPFLKKAVNLKRGRPIVEIALGRLAVEIENARNEGVTVLVLVHGYGSSGKGGIIREECRKLLEHMRRHKEINDFVPGDGGIKSGPVKALFRRYPHLRHDRELAAPNPGITTVVL